ncbi:hypothetical protein ILYODFUR_005532 [Ilyodon furcidens]|uniref:Uncharacterized protein n=1 Tax=Ilyodon furcidens TaxID=33524 RepID=A0ABV0VBB9_9TELE
MRSNKRQRNRKRNEREAGIKQSDTGEGDALTSCMRCYGYWSPVCHTPTVAFSHFAPQHIGIPEVKAKKRKISCIQEKKTENQGRWKGSGAVGLDVDAGVVSGRAVDG